MVSPGTLGLKSIKSLPSCVFNAIRFLSLETKKLSCKKAPRESK